MSIPKYDELFNPTLKALKNLGGSATNQELEDAVSELLGISEKELSIMQPGHNRSKYNYRLAWARSYLKKYGLIENNKRGVWSLTKKGKELNEVDKDVVNREVKKIKKEIKIIKDEEDAETSNVFSWKEELLNLLKTIKPDAFERLCKRFLRESGFIQVEVSGKSGDGGIDGHGVVQIGGLLSFHVYFQAKRYKNTVPSSIIRDFRGAMVGRADKGLIITTGLFTRDAQKEAQRDGTTPIDLIDGDKLVEKLKELRLGINIKEKIVEEINIDKDWFLNI